MFKTRLDSKAWGLVPLDAFRTAGAACQRADNTDEKDPVREQIAHAMLLLLDADTIRSTGGFND